MWKAVKKFFTSIKVAIVLLIILIGASILGTLIPQGRSAQEYLVRYGQLAGLFQKLQFTRLYQSVWYIAVLALFGLNLIICTLVRLGPKLRRVFNPRCDLEPKTIQVTVSIGLASSDPDISSSELLLEAADNALYEAKRTGRNKVVTAEEEPQQRSNYVI